MSNTLHRPPRRGPTPEPYPQQQYASVPRSPQGRSVRAPTPDHVQTGRGAIVQGVATGSIGGDYGPYSYDPSLNRANSAADAGARLRKAPSAARPNMARTTTVNAQLEDKNLELDDALHNPDPRIDARLDRSFDVFSSRGWINATALIVLVAGLLMLFAGYPILVAYTHPGPPAMGFNIGGINGSGQVPKLTGFPKLIDDDTPESAYTHTTTDGRKYNLVFSDEFNRDGRTFYPGDDPYWEAVDLHYWPTGDLEWYDPRQVTTQDGKLVITLEEMPSHSLNFQSGMLQSWNKLCFTTGYIEISVSLPGHPTEVGYWPAAWTMGNLGRAGYGSSTEGMWPYSYDSCDVGTFPNQTDRDDTPTEIHDAKLSYLPGQRLSACTCPGSDHPGPRTSAGRNVPEIDIIEAQVSILSDFVHQGEVSQSVQVAPFNFHYAFDNSTKSSPIVDTSVTHYNDFKGGPFQQSVSAVTHIDSQYYSGFAYASYGFEWYSNPSNRDSGYVNWVYNGKKTWTVTPASIGADDTAKIAGRLISEEPMYIIFNLGMSPGFLPQDFSHMVFPTKMFVDYVRVYQLPGTKDGLTCDPPSHPTRDYIEKHLQAYSNPNLTTWAQAGYTFPRNSKYDGC